MSEKRLAHVLLPVTGLAMALALWSLASQYISDLPSPVETWQESKIYLLQPLEKRGEMDQGIVRLAYVQSRAGGEGFS